jgi:hypothetical protein
MEERKENRRSNRNIKKFDKRKRLVNTLKTYLFEYDKIFRMNGRNGEKIEVYRAFWDENLIVISVYDKTGVNLKRANYFDSVYGVVEALIKHELE